MKIIKLDNSMEPLVYLLRHWGRWHYVDLAGNMLPVKQVLAKLKELGEQ